VSDLAAAQPPPAPDATRPRPNKLRVLLALMLREMSTRYGRNPGGYFWALVEPLAMIMVLAIGFSLLLRNPSLGNSFLLFYATGFLPFTMFMRTSLYVQTALRYSRPLLNYPVVSWFDVTMARAITNGLTMCMTAVFLFAGILGYIPGVQTLEPAPIAAAFLAAFVLGIGVGLMNGVLAGFFPVWATLWNIATAPIFILSGVIWIFEDLPPLGQQVLVWNPLVHILGQARSGFFPTYGPQYLDLVYVWGLALVALALCLLLMRRFHRDILQNR
jgi:capsular polysaccharide transport system permease protein